MLATHLDLSHEARVARITAYHRMFLASPVAAPSPAQVALGAGSEGAAIRAAGTKARKTGRDEERTTVAPAAPPSGTP